MHGSKAGKSSQKLSVDFPENFSVKEEQSECKEKRNLNSTFSLAFFFFLLLCIKRLGITVMPVTELPW